MKVYRKPWVLDIHADTRLSPKPISVNQAHAHCQPSASCVPGSKIYTYGFFGLLAFFPSSYSNSLASLWSTIRTLIEREIAHLSKSSIITCSIIPTRGLSCIYRDRYIHTMANCVHNHYSNYRTLNFILSMAANFKSSISPMPSLILWPLTSLLIPTLLVCLMETILKSVVSGSSRTIALSVAGTYTQHETVCYRVNTV